MRTTNDRRTRDDIEQTNLSDTARSRTLSRLALAAIVLASGWTAWTYMSGSGEEAAASLTEPQSLSINGEAHHAAVANAYSRLSNALKNQARRSAAVITNEVALFDSRFTLGYPPGSFSLAAALGKRDREPQVRASLGDTGVVPTPDAPPKPSLRERVMAKAASAAKLLRSTRTASPRDGAQPNVAADTQERAPSIFERLFGKPQPVTLAYASPEDGSLGLGASGAGRYDRYTAVYDISAHTVYLPDGTQLEAHSGLGSRMDDPRYVHERMHGPTPPTLYDLKMREAPFHGVKAIRLIPVDEEAALGRSGLLAHTYMLGTRGDSNGCVSFRDYNAFLQAYQSQKIKRLAVVTHL